MWLWLEGARREGLRELGRKEREWWWLEWLTALKYFLSQKRDLLTDCQKCDGRTYRMTMRGEGLSCYVQLKNR